MRSYAIGQQYAGEVAMLLESGEYGKDYRFLRSYEDKSEAETGKAIYTIDDILRGEKYVRYMVNIDFYAPDGSKMNRERRFIRIWTKSHLTRTVNRYGMSLIEQKP